MRCRLRKLGGLIDDGELGLPSVKLLPRHAVLSRLEEMGTLAVKTRGHPMKILLILFPLPLLSAGLHGEGSNRNAATPSSDTTPEGRCKWVLASLYCPTGEPKHVSSHVEQVPGSVEWQPLF